jgi:hypothetical protein
VQNDHERTARRLATALVTAGIDARAHGEGVHWRVEVEGDGTRSAKVHCFWYEGGGGVRELGTSAGNQRYRLGVVGSTYAGATYVVTLAERDARGVDGRTTSERDAVDGVRRWLGGERVDALAQALPFVDGERRTLRALATRLDPRLRWELADELGTELWVYAGDRSCSFRGSYDANVCSFRFGQVQLALGVVADPPGAVAAWLVDGVAVDDLAARAPGVVLERHAGVLAIDPLRWHWLHMRDRITDPEDALAELRPLIERLAESPIATAFYCDSSLSWLCFSASSHYPHVARDLPVVGRTTDGTYRVDKRPCDLDTAVALIEHRLSASPARPFFGSKVHFDIPYISAHFERRGSALRPRAVLRKDTYRLIVGTDTRCCDIDVVLGDVTFYDGATSRRTTWPTRPAAVDAMCRFLDDGVPLAEIQPAS